MLYILQSTILRFQLTLVKEFINLFFYFYEDMFIMHSRQIDVSMYSLEKKKIIKNVICYRIISIWRKCNI